MIDVHCSNIQLSLFQAFLLVTFQLYLESSPRRVCQTMAQLNRTPEDYFTDEEPRILPVTSTVTANSAQQPVRLSSPVPSPGTAIATNMVAQRNLLPAVPGGHNSRGAKRISRSRSPSATPPRGRWATNSPLLGRREHHFLARPVTRAQAVRLTTQHHPRSQRLARSQQQAAQRAGTGHRS